VEAFQRVVAALIFGVLNGYDRLMFRGYLREIGYVGGLHKYCGRNGVLYKDYKRHALWQTQRLIEASQAEAKRLGRPIEYLPSTKIRKEEYARRIAQRDRIDSGLIAVLRCVEPCNTLSVRGNIHTKKLEFHYEVRRCVHLYHYFQDPTFGLLYVRLQSWVPYTVQIGMNGREWLCRQLDEAGIAYRRQDNCTTWIEDMAAAQRLFDTQLRVHWPTLLDELRTRAHPLHPKMLGNFRSDYYWVLDQSEWATDVLFQHRADLQARYDSWMKNLTHNLSSVDVLRFLGRKIPSNGMVNRKIKHEVMTNVGDRLDGVRIKHYAGLNSIKMYDKAGGRVLRVETTIQDTTAFKVFRTKENDPDGEMAYRCMRSGVADIHRRAEVSQAANSRYLERLAAVNHQTSLATVIEPLGRRVKEPGERGRWLRGLNPMIGEDAQLLEVIARPEFNVAGMRNRDIVAGMYEKPTEDPAEAKSRSARASRLLRLLRAHKLIRKLPKTHRYQLTELGREVATLVLAARNASMQKLSA
jgi:hypothetical protein